MVNAHEAGLVLGQRAVEGKSNEITAIPNVLEMLEISGAVVSIDAMAHKRLLRPGKKASRLSAGP